MRCRKSSTTAQQGFTRATRQTNNFTSQENPMKHMRFLFAAFVLASVLSVSPFAGNMHTGAPQPAPAPTPATAEGEIPTTFNGDMHTTNSDEATAGDAVAAGALSLLQSVLSLL
jgi:hypothetical protein